MASPRRRPSRDRITRYYRFTVVAGVLTVIFCTVSVIFFSLELDRLDQFFNNYQRQQWSNREISKTHYDKNYFEVPPLRMAYLLKMARIEKAVLAAALCANIALIVAAGGLIKGAVKRKPRMFAFWAASLFVAFLIGLAYTLMDCVIYGFTSRTNGMLLTWLGFGIIFGHCLRSVYRYAQMLRITQLSRQRHSAQSSPSHPQQDCGVAVFDVSIMGHNIFTISGGESTAAPAGPGVMVHPPCYEEAVLAGPSKPPDIDDMPPGYEP